MTATKRSGVFLYYVGRKALQDGLPKGDVRVYKMLKRHKEGLTFRELVARLKMPGSTVDWARIRLMKCGAMLRKRATA